MGEMIKFGIKLAMTIATAVALVAAIAILFSTVSTLISGLSLSLYLAELFHIVQVYFPINIYLIMTLIVSLGSFKVAYWAADKMIQFLEAAG